MTRKHFVALAAALKQTRPALSSPRDTWSEVVVAVADVCSSFNGQFDRSRFNEAAGLDKVPK